MPKLLKAYNSVLSYLDNSHKARMARAEADEFIPDLFHGTAEDIRAFDSAHGGKTTKAQSAKDAFWLVDNPETAAGYADLAGENNVKNLLDEHMRAEVAGDWDRANDLMRQAEELDQVLERGQNIMPLRAKGRFMEYDAEGRWMQDLDESELSKLVIQAKAEGYDGLKMLNFVDEAGYGVNRPATHYAVFDPKNIRSKYADFDPAKRDSANLLASLTGAGVVGGAAIGSEEAEAAVFGKPVKFIEAMLKKGQQVLYHSGDASLAEDIAKYGIEPEHGPWIREVLGGSVDDVDQFLDEVPAAAWFSESPDWVGIKAARASGIPYGDITDADIAKHGHLSIVDPKNTWDEGAEFYRIPKEGLANGEYTEVRNLAGDPPQKLYETPLYGESMSGGGRYTEGLESGDIVSTEGVEAVTTLTGDDLVDFLRRNYPDKLKKQTTQRGNASPEMLTYLATTAAATQYFQAREQKRGFFATARQEIGQMIDAINDSPAIKMLGHYSGQALESLELPMKGFHGLSAVGGQLLAGNTLEGSLDRAGTVARQPIEQTAQEYGDTILDATGSPIAATVAYTAGVLADPF